MFCFGLMDIVRRPNCMDVDYNRILIFKWAIAFIKKRVVSISTNVRMARTPSKLTLGSASSPRNAHRKNQ